MTNKELRQLRRIKDVTQKQIAEHLGLSEGMISRVEKGTRKLNQADELKYIQFLESYEVE